MQSSENKKNFGFGTQIRKSPYFDATVSWGAKDFSAGIGSGDDESRATLRRRSVL